MIGADAIIKCLEAEDVKMVFGYPGVAICPFYNSILDSDIKTILIRTEQNASPMPPAAWPESPDVPAYALLPQVPAPPM